MTERAKTLLRSLLGDGIEDVQTTADGRIWVSYFDEGVVGNFGWGDWGGPEPVGAAGLIRWRADGTKEWEYEPPAGVDQIVDCYALNVADDVVWAYYYSDFPLVRIARDESISAWTTPGRAARALAVGGGHALFYGGQGDVRDACLLLEFAGQELVERETLRLITPSGESFRHEHVMGRSAFLHAFDGPLWYRLDVRRVAADHEWMR